MTSGRVPLSALGLIVGVALVPGCVQSRDDDLLVDLPDQLSYRVDEASVVAFDSVDQTPSAPDPSPAVDLGDGPDSVEQGVSAEDVDEAP